MPREDIEFRTHDHVTLRGWFYTPAIATSSNMPCLVLSHGFSAVKEMDLDLFAEYFISKLPLSCLVYDNRGFGASDVKEGQPRQEIIPTVQCSDISDAITYAQSRNDVDADKIGIWGSSYAGGHVLWVGAVDRRVKAVLSQIPCVSGYDTFHRLIRPDFVAGLNALFQEGRQHQMCVGVDKLAIVDRLGRFTGKHPQTMPVVDQDPLKPSALPTLDSYEFLTAWGKKSNWKNEVTVKSYVFPSCFSASSSLLRPLLTFTDAASKPCANMTLPSTSTMFHLLLF